MLKFKDHDKFLLISDSVSFAGLEHGCFDDGWVTPLNVTEEGFL